MNINSKKKIVSAIIIWIISSMFLVLKTDTFTSFINYFFVFLLLLSVSIFSIILINHLIKKKQFKTYISIIIKTLCAILFFIISLTTLIFIDDTLHTSFLKNYGKYTNSFVLEVNDIDHSNDDEVCACIEKNIKIVYKVNSKNYYKNFDIEDFYEKGDTLLVKYLPIAPDIFETCPNNTVIR